MSTVSIERPLADEYAPYFERYISLVTESDILRALVDQPQRWQAAFSPRAISSEQETQLHAPYTWTIRQVVGHVIDTERIFAYRALRFAAGDETNLPGFDQDAYVANSHFNDVPLAQLNEELTLVRKSTVAMMERFPADSWKRAGDADGKRITVRAIAYLLVGHARHHQRIVEKRLTHS